MVRFSGVVRTPRRLAGCVGAVVALVASLLVVVVEAEPVAAVGAEPVVHFVVDLSGSMASAGTPGNTRLEDAQEAVSATVGLLVSAEVALGLRTYWSSSSNRCVAAQASPVVPIATDNAGDVLSAVAAFSTQSSYFTPTQDALQRGIDDVEAYATTGTKRLVLITDGLASCATPSLCDVAQDNLDANVQFELYTVGLALTSPSIVEDLECAAEATGGTYGDADPDTLAEKIAEAVTSGSYAMSEPERRGRVASGGYAGDPVSTAYGNFFDSYVDLPAPANVFGLGVSRSYNSFDDEGLWMGPGWRGPYSRQLLEESGDYRLILEDGRHVIFESDGVGGWVQPWEFTGELVLDPNGVDEVVFPDGERWSFDGDGWLVGLSSWDGQSVAIHRGAWGEPLDATSSLGPSLEFFYTADRLTDIEVSDGRSVSYVYDGSGHLVSYTDASGGVTDYSVDGSGRLLSITDPAGVVLVDNTYSNAGRVVSQTTPDSTTTFAYNFLTRTTTVATVETGETLLYEHDEFGRVVKLTDPDGKFITKAYGGGGWMSSGVSRLGGETVLSFDSTGNPTSVLAADGVHTTYIYDSEHRVVSESTPATGTTTYTYVGASRVPSTIVDGDSNVTTQTVSDGLVAKSTDPDGVEVLFRYNLLRQLIEIEDAYGNVTELSYDAAGRLVGTETPSGSVTMTEYDDAGRVVKQTAADGGEVVTDYDDAGRVVKVTDQVGAETSYAYEPGTGLLASTTDPMGRVTTFDYDSVGRLERTTFHDASFTETDHGRLGRVVAERDELGREITYEHDDDGNLTKATDPAGGVVEVDYDSAGRPSTETDPAGRETEYDYDPLTGQLLSEMTPAGITSYVYDDLGRVSEVTDHRGGVTTTTYTPAGRVATVTDPVGLVTEYDYDDAGRPAGVTAPGELETSFDYDADGRIVTVTSPGGLETSLTYDPVGRVLTETDPAGVTVTNTWSLRGEIRTVTRSGEGTVEYTYFADGQLDRVDDALGNRTSFAYDQRGRLATRTDPNGKVWHTTYNPAGELVAETDPLSRTTSYSYDPAGRLANVADPSGRTLTYSWRLDGLMESWSATDGTDTISAELAYDPAGRRTAAILQEAGIPKQWNYAYTPGGDLASVTDHLARTLAYSYDSAGRLTGTRRADGSGVAVTHDPAGRVQAITPTETFADSFTGTTGAPDVNKWAINSLHGGTAELADNHAQLSVPATPAANVSLHGVGAEPAPNGDSTLTYRFDSTDGISLLNVYQRYIAAGDNYRLQIEPGSTTARIYRSVWGNTAQIASFSVPADTHEHRVRFQVSGTTIRAKVWDSTDPEPETWSATVNDGWLIGFGRPRVTYQHIGGPSNQVHLDDFVHRDPTVAPAPLVTYTWDDDGRLTGESLHNGGTRAWTWTEGQLTRSEQAGIPGLGNRTTDLTYHSSGRLGSESTAGITTAYSYDGAGQLTAATPTSGPATTWTYDALGRRTSQSIGAESTTFAYDDAGQLTGSTPTSGPATVYEWDAAGRLVGDATVGGGSNAFDYDVVGRLRSVSGPGGELQTRSYSPDGDLHRVLNTLGADVTEHVLDWDIAGARAELVSIATATASSGHNSGTHLTRAPGARAWATSHNGRHIRDLPADAHGSTLPGALSSIGAAPSYSPWGEPQNATATLSPRLGYRGELQLGDLVHLRAREYRPDLGVFTSTDPLAGTPGTTTLNNPYHYTNNTPLNLTDPTGLAPEDDIFDPLQARPGWDPIDLLGHPCEGPDGTASFESRLAAACVYVNILGSLTYADCLNLSAHSGLCLESVHTTRTNRLRDGLQQALDIVGAYSDVLTSLLPGADCVKTLDTRSAGHAATCAASILPILGMTARGIKASTTATKHTPRATHSLDDLSRAAGMADRNGLTAAGRAAQKHGNRPGSSFPLSPDRTASGYNQFGQNLVDDLLTAPNTATQRWAHPQLGQVTDFWGPNYGVRFGPNGEFIGFLDP